MKKEDFPMPRMNKKQKTNGFTNERDWTVAQQEAGKKFRVTRCSGYSDRDRSCGIIIFSLFQCISCHISLQTLF